MEVSTNTIDAEKPVSTWKAGFANKVVNSMASSFGRLSNASFKSLSQIRRHTKSDQDIPLPVQEEEAVAMSINSFGGVALPVAIGFAVGGPLGAIALGVFNYLSGGVIGSWAVQSALVGVGAIAKTGELGFKAVDLVSDFSSRLMNRRESRSNVSPGYRDAPLLVEDRNIPSEVVDARSQPLTSRAPIPADQVDGSNMSGFEYHEYQKELMVEKIRSAILSRKVDVLEKIWKSAEEQGTSINLNDPSFSRSGELPLSEAIYGGDDKCIDFLLRKGADVNQFDCKGRPAWYAAVMSERYELNTKLINEYGAKVNIQNPDGDTVLHMATIDCLTESYWDRKPAAIEKIAYLMCHGADCHKTNNSGDSPASYYSGIQKIALKSAVQGAMFHPVAPQDPYAPKKNSNSSLGM